MKVTLLIPCLNEAATIREVVAQAKKAGKTHLGNQFELIVADNGSTDGTLTILSKLEHIRILHVLLPGYGATLHSGILAARSPYVFFADADLSYNFDEISAFIPLMEKDYDLILGSRFRGKILPQAMPWLNRYLGTPFLTFLIRLLYSIPTTDCNSGMRAVKQSFYHTLVMKNSGMEWASELLIKTALKHGRYKEVPIVFQPDQRQRKPHLKRWEDGWRHLKVVILLRPSVLLWLAAGAVGLGSIALPRSLFTTIAMWLFSEFLILSYLAAKLLEGAIQNKQSRVSLVIVRLPLVLCGTALTIVGVLAIIFIPDTHLFTKYILLFEATLVDLWIFFIETIKTHLLNRLPSEKKEDTVLEKKK